MIIDSHQHFWQLDQPFHYDWLKTDEHAPINKTYLPQDLLPHLKACGIDQSVFVQTQHDVAENRWVLKLAEANDFIAGVVGWVDLASEACEQQLSEFKDHPKFVGIRHVVQDEPDDNFIVNPNVLRGLKVLEKHQVPYDLLFYTKHLKHATAVADTVPRLKLVIDHLSKPQIQAGLIDSWKVDLKAAASRPNVYCKLSGMVTEADWKTWSAADLQPYVDVVLEAFGPERCMYGSDWPVCELAGSYESVFRALKDCIGQLSESEQAAILGHTAAGFYDLNV
ncbi:MAG: amidohydrolase family protein [Fuerstiella sp.]